MGLVGALMITGLFVVPSRADAPTPCHNDTNMTRNYTHGSPITGLVYRHGYYYLDVKFGPGCGLGADGLVHLVAKVTVQASLSAIGALPGVTPDFDAMYWVEFHGYGSTGKEYTFENSPYVTTPSETMPCKPNTTIVKCVCAGPPENFTFTLHYDGPDVFGLAKGSDARFRIAQETPDKILTDFASLDIVS